MSPKPKDLVKTVLKLASEGPVNTLATPRLVRLLFNGEYIVQTTSALFVWEHPYYPQYYLPKSALLESKAKDFEAEKGNEIKDSKGKVVATRYKLKVKDRFTDACVVFSDDLSGKAEVLKGLVKLEFGAIDRWFEEDMPIAVHPKDPYKRVDIVPSTRRVQVFIDKFKVAETTSSMHLYETGLPRRVYMPLTDVDVRMLRPSDTRTQCPYKGEAEYYSVDTGSGSVAEDVVWYYTRPTIECAKIEGLLCFYDEKVDLRIDDFE